MPSVYSIRNDLKAIKIVAEEASIGEIRDLIQSLASKLEDTLGLVEVLAKREKELTKAVFLNNNAHR